MPAGKFKDGCLKTLDEVASTRTEVLITKRGKPVAKLVPYTDKSQSLSLKDSIIKEAGDPFSTGEPLDADAS
ncbi:MAG TPA: type II toxin-antitoxin system Phd/YefM family antitoxin [Candidatus Binatia bacterium]|nr:type II toxin-antitoxin system Phd/YefM family antitoxin [Candidatus Binatia bacterium]